MLSRGMAVCSNSGRLALRSSGAAKALSVQLARAFTGTGGIDGGGEGGGDGGSAPSITYSGGQATTGQGGFYGAGGARAFGKPQTTQRLEAVAHAADIVQLTRLMDEVSELEAQVRQAGDDMARKIQIKAQIKKKMTSKEMTDLLKRLQLRGEPVWGLSISERELVREAKRKLNTC